jgi:hypothetical protein
MARRRKHGFDLTLFEFVNKLTQESAVPNPVKAIVIDADLWWKVFDELRRRRLVSTGERIVKAKQFVLNTPQGFVTVWRQDA